MRQRRDKKAEKLQVKRIQLFASKGIIFASKGRSSAEGSKLEGQMGSVKVRTRIGGRSYEASISEETLLKAWCTIMKDGE